MGLDVTGTTEPATDAAGIDLTDAIASRQRADAVLRELAGATARLRDDQWTAIDALVRQHRRALVVQRTGWGKSAVYFVATDLLRAQGAGPTVIVSPLLALMRNQLAAAASAGINAVTINSANQTEWDDVQARIADGSVDLLLVSPERLNNPEFRDQALPKLTATTGLLVVDEAHCISDWGHDFRPDYRRLRTLLGELPTGVPVLATTATANDRVVADVADQLGIGVRSPGDTLVLRGPLDRASLRLSVVRLATPQARLAWLAERLAQLPGSGIIYTLTVAAAQDVAAMLTEHGYATIAYTGKTDATERAEAEADLLANRVKAVVATSALGMGFDKPDLGFVVHLGAPSSPISYYQQIGRAGRGVERAEVILLPGVEDAEIWRYFASLAFPDERTVRSVLAALDAADRPQSTIALEPRVDLSRSRLEMVLKVLDVDGAVRRVRSGWESTGAPWHYDADRYQRISRARSGEQQAMLDYAATDRCRMKFLLDQLDDPHATVCGRCDNCTGEHYPTTVSDADADAARKRMTRPGIPIGPRKQWPSGLKSLRVPFSGRIPAELQHAEGRAIGRLTDIGMGNQLRALLAPHVEDQPVPEPLLKACVAVLASWDWASRPMAVAGIASSTRPVLARDLATRLAHIGRLEFLGMIESGGSTPRRSNSAQRVAQIVERLWLSDQLRDKVSTMDGPVLMVDDLVDTGWTMAIGAKLLREAGADAVLPFALATTN